jgi:hypothetical protein
VNFTGVSARTSTAGNENPAVTPMAVMARALVNNLRVKIICSP